MSQLLLADVIKETYKKLAFVDSNTLYTSGDGSADAQPQLNGLKLNSSTALTSTSDELNQIDGVTPGTASANKALVMGGSANIAGIGTIGSGAITSSGIIKTDDATEATSTTDGSLQTDGGLSVVKDCVFGHDVKLLSDSSILSFGADSDTTLTHTDGTGLTLNSTNKICFNDASQFIQGSSATVLSLGATDEIDLTATDIDINGRVDVSGNAVLNANVTLGTDVDSVITINGAIAGTNALVFEGSGADGNETTFAITNPTGDRTITFPDATGTVMLSDSTATLTNKTLGATTMSGALNTAGQNITRTEASTVSLWAGAGQINIGDATTASVAMKNINLKSSTGGNTSSEIQIADDGVIEVKETGGDIPFKIDSTSSNKQITLATDNTWKSVFNSTVEMEALTTFKPQDAFKLTDGSESITFQRPANIASNRTITVPDRSGELFVQATAAGLPTTFKGFSTRSQIFKYEDNNGSAVVSKSYFGWSTITDATGTTTITTFESAGSSNFRSGLFLVTTQGVDSDMLLCYLHQDNNTITEVEIHTSNITGTPGTNSCQWTVANSGAQITVWQILGDMVITNLNT